MIDASKTIEELHEEIKTLSKEIINGIESEKIGKLWVEDAILPPPGKRKRVEENGNYIHDSSEVTRL